MKNHKTSKTPAVVYRRHLAGMPFVTKPPPGTHRVAERPDLHKSKSVRLLGHSLQPELAGLIEKTLRESEASSTEEGTQTAEDDISCLKEIKKKVHESRKDKEGDHRQEEPASKHTTEKQKEKAEIKLEDVLLDIKKNPSPFVEIDLRDQVEEEKTEAISTEEKLLEKEEEPPTAVKPGFGILTGREERGHLFLAQMTNYEPQVASKNPSEAQEVLKLIGETNLYMTMSA